MLQNLVDSGQWTVDRKMQAEGKGMVNFRQVGIFRYLALKLQKRFDFSAKMLYNYSV